MAFGADQGQLQEFLEILKRRRWQVILPASFVLAFGVVFAVIVPKKFEVFTEIEIRPKRLESDYLLKNPEATATATEVQNAENHIRHFFRIQDIINSQSNLWPEYVKLNNSERHIFVRNVLKSVRVDVRDKRKDRGSTFIEVTYKDTRPQRAELFLTALTERWITEVVERDKNNLRGEREVLQNQVKESEAEWQRLNRQYIDICKQMEIDPRLSMSSDKSDREKDPYYRDLDATREVLQETQQDRAIVLGELDELKVQLEEQPQEIPEPVIDKGVNLETQIAEYEQSIADLRRRQVPLTPANSKYQVIEREIEEMNAKILESKSLERAGKISERWIPNPRILELRREIEQKQATLAGQNRQIAELGSQIEKKSALAAARAEDYRDLFDVYERRERAREKNGKLSNELKDKQNTLDFVTKAWDKPFSIVEAPQASDTPSEPNALLIVTVATLMGLALGLGVSMAAEFSGNAYRSGHELGQIMSIPVLGSINTIVTRKEARWNRMRRSIVGLASVVILAGIGWMTYMWANNPESLPVPLTQAIADIRMKFLF